MDMYKHVLYQASRYLIIDYVLALPFRSQLNYSICKNVLMVNEILRGSSPYHTSVFVKMITVVAAGSGCYRKHNKISTCVRQQAGSPP